MHSSLLIVPGDTTTPYISFLFEIDAKDTMVLGSVINSAKADTEKKDTIACGLLISMRYPPPPPSPMHMTFGVVDIIRLQK